MKGKISVVAMGLLFCSMVLISGDVHAGVIVRNLTCEGGQNPLAIQSTQPVLGWKIESSERNTLQEAYQVIVASSPEKLSRNEGDLWNSGKVLSDGSLGIVYSGKVLKSRTDCFWKVKVWTNRGESGWSEYASWSEGLLNYNDWDGRWIGFDRTFPGDSDTFHSRLSARYFRKDFKVEKPVKRAKVYIIGLGLYELSLNGSKIGDQVLAPSPTDYLQNVKYNVFDVTQQLKVGENAIGVILGNGRYYTMRQHYKNYKIKNFGFPKMLLQLEIEYTDGTKNVVTTNNSWKGTADGPILSNNEYDGEEYNAQKEFAGWDQPGFADSAWIAAEYVEETPGRFEAQVNPNMKVMQSIKPVSIKQLEPGKYILDMGQNMVGWVKLRVKGNPGDQVKLRFSEILTDKGELFTANLRDAKATDIYTLKGVGAETWEPRFVFHGFRYVEITGYPGTPTVDDFTGQVVYDEMATTGSFETSNPILNQVFKNSWWGICGNYKGMPLDCPQRNERQPWLADRAIGCYGESFIFDNQKLYEKWADDIAYSQKWDGSIGDVAPNFWRYNSDNVTWPGTFILVADMLYVRYGNKQPIIDHYQAMKKWLDYMRNQYMSDRYIITKDTYGDWCPPPATIEEGRGKSADKKTPNPLLSTAYYYYFMQLMQKFADISGNRDDKEQYKQLAENMLLGFNKEFYKGNGVYGSNTLTENVLALGLGLVPEEEYSKVANNIADIVDNKNQGHLSTGVIGTQWLMRTLTRIGRADLAYRVATTTTYPGWGYMVENGATTIWELWNGNTAAPSMNSYNHVMMLGDLIVWDYESLAGIKSDETATGFKSILMKPEFVDGLDWVKASYCSVYGNIKSEWSKKKGTLDWKIVIPSNTLATVSIPAKSAKEVTESGKPLSACSDIKLVNFENGRATLELGSGDYVFKSKF